MLGNTLIGDVASLSAAAGGTVNFSLFGPGDPGGRGYFLLAGLSGTSPGVPIGSIVLPLNYDALMLFSFRHPNSAKVVRDQDADHQESVAARKVPVEVRATGYAPDMVMAKAGEPITIVFTRVAGDGCVEKLLIPSEGIERDLPLNTPVEITFTPAKSGNLGFSCGMNMIKGTIMVH